MQFVLTVLLAAGCAMSAQVAVPRESEALFSTPSSLAPISLSGSLSGSSGSGCQPDQPGCQAPASSSADNGLTVEELERQGFKVDRLRPGHNLYRLAKNTVAPLIKKLMDTMKKDQEKLTDSDKSILRHAEEDTAHLFKLLKADVSREAERERLVQELMEAKNSQNEAEEKANAALGISSEAAKRLESIMGYIAGRVPFRSVQVFLPPGSPSPPRKRE